MFGRKPKIQIDMIVPTSKMSLKASCIKACGNDIEAATKLYEFFAKDLTNLPDFDIVPPNAFQQAKDFIASTFAWIDGNQDKLVGYYNIFQQLRGGQPLPILPQSGTPPTDVPPIPNK